MEDLGRALQLVSKMGFHRVWFLTSFREKSYHIRSGRQKKIVNQTTNGQRTCLSANIKILADPPGFAGEIKLKKSLFRIILKDPFWS